MVPAHGIVTKTVHETLPGGGEGPGMGGYRVTGSGGGSGGGVAGGLFDMKLTLSEIKDDNIKFIILATILMFL